eukprot:2479133-Rhodomonas_salina.1
MLLALGIAPASPCTCMPRVCHGVSLSPSRTMNGCQVDDGMFEKRAAWMGNKWVDRYLSESSPGLMRRFSGIFDGGRGST